MSTITTKIGELYRNLVTLELKKRLSNSSDVIMLNYHKLRSAEMTQLRKDLKGAGASILVTKNSFARKVLDEVKKPAEVLSYLDGPMAFIFVKDDPVAVSKVLVDFAKTHEAAGIRGGLMSERVLTLEDIKRLSKIPSRHVLLGQVASALNAPIGKLAMSLNQIVAKLAYALKAVSDKKNQ
jgi:large subunit ribosomal protein L10